MSINVQSNDLVTGVDFTGIGAAQGADINNGIDLAVPVNAGDDTIGRGLILTTTDTALNVPDVPNPVTTADFAKFKRYQWNRRPFPGAAVKGCLSYQWNDDAPNDATFLKWVETFVDTTVIAAQAANALATANNAVTIANNAGTLAGNANTTANTANAAATAAMTAATNASTAAAAAQDSATAAQTSANAAQTTANQALALAPKQSLFTKFSETKAKGVDNGNSAVGKNTRVFNTVDYAGATANISLDTITGLITINVGGYYYIECEATMYDTAATTHQLFIVDNVSNNNLIEGFSHLFSGATLTERAKVCGIVQLLNSQVIRADHYIANVKAGGLGKAANINPNAAGKEIYSTIILIPIGGN